MSGSPSIADWIGGFLYLCTACACLYAATFTLPEAIGRKFRGHWAGIAALLVALAVIRVGQFEEATRNALRGALRSDGGYDARWEIQGPAMVVVLLALVAGGIWLYLTAVNRPRAVTLARAGALGMVGLLMVRIVSIHMIDQLIYSGIGPLRLNHLYELGLLGLICWGVWEFTLGRAVAAPQAEGSRRRKRRRRTRS